MGYICNMDCELTITNAVQGSAVIQTPPSSFVKVGGKFAYRGQLSIQVSGFTGTKISGGTGVGVLSPNARHTKIDNQLAVLEGAEVDITCLGTDIMSGTPLTPETAKVKITSAGQSEVSGT